MLKQKYGEKTRLIIPFKRNVDQNEDQEKEFFCDLVGLEPLHEFSTFNVNISLYEMVTVMGDRDLLLQISGRDLVALEARSHFNCLSKYRNNYHLISDLWKVLAS